MRKKFTSIIAVFMSVLVSLSSGIGCNKKEAGEKIDHTKTQLFVNHYDGGVGHEWLNSSETGRDGIKQAFEKLYADYQGENGKVGVQVIVNNHKSDGNAIYNQLKDTTEEIFFTSGSKYFDMVSSDYLLDISDVYTQVNTDGKTVESKMTEEQKEYYKVNNAYYALPHYESFFGINYNVNIFNEEEFFFEKGGAPSEFCDFVQNNNDDACEGEFEGYSYTDLDGDLSAGPDGLYGTFDDGQAATYEEFFVLCAQMVEQGVVPFIWSGGMAGSYLEGFMSAFRSAYEGREQLRLAYDFDGWTGFEPYATHLVKFDTEGNILFNEDGTVQLREPTLISNATGYEMYSSAGYYYAAEFLSRILSNSDNYSSNATNAHSHTDAQVDFVLSEFDTRYSKDKKQIAMFVEGNYWENEARDYGAFKRLSNYKKTVNDVAYGRMAFPKVSESEIGKKQTIAEAQQSNAFISKNIPAHKVELAKAFLKFCYTDQNLAEFTAVTGVTKSLDYEVGADKVDRLTPFAKSFIETKKNSDVVYMVSNNIIYKVGQTNFTSAYFSTDSYQWGSRQMLDTGASAEELLKGIMRKHSKSSWESSYRNYI
ncbi:MAG: hypothetical protein IJA88_00975 [Clostridia bacterium]|nr:hypothetical protein [Clostridia bacterium]